MNFCVIVDLLLLYHAYDTLANRVELGKDIKLQVRKKKKNIFGFE